MLIQVDYLQILLLASTSADAEIKDNIRILRDRARELARND